MIESSTLFRNVFDEQKVHRFCYRLVQFYFFPVRGKKYEPDRSDSKYLSLTLSKSLTLSSSFLVKCPLHTRSLTPAKSKSYSSGFKIP